ncbi:MAG: hypothetical protein U0P30_05790 [Vicinamibacterales bacterium]
MIDREKEMVRLGASGLDGRRLTREAGGKSRALSKFERLARSHQVDEILAAATSATREAENGGDFLRDIEAHTGIRPRVITGTDEARLIHRAAVYGIDTPTRRWSSTSAAAASRWRSAPAIRCASRAASRWA